MPQTLKDFFGPSAYAETRLGVNDNGGWVHFYWPELAPIVNGTPDVYTDAQIVATLLAYLHKKLAEMNSIDDPTHLIAVDGDIVKSQVLRGSTDGLTEPVEQLSYALTFLIFRPDPTDFDPDFVTF